MFNLDFSSIMKDIGLAEEGVEGRGAGGGLPWWFTAGIF